MKHFNTRLCPSRNNWDDSKPTQKGDRSKTWEGENMNAKNTVDISFSQVDNSVSAHNIVIAFHPGVFQGIVFIHREAMVKEGDS